MNRSSLLQITYNQASLDGMVIESLKNSKINTSKVVRSYLTQIQGYQVLKNVGVSHRELIEFCIKNIQFFHAQHEIARINLEQELKSNHQYNFSREDIIVAKFADLSEIDGSN